MNQTNNKSHIANANYSLLMLYFIVCVFFLPFSMRMMVYPMQMLMVIVPLFYKIINERTFLVNKYLFAGCVGVIAIIILVICFSEYSQFYLIKAYLALFLVIIYSRYGIYQRNRHRELFFIRIIVALFVVELIIQSLGRADLIERLLFGDANYREIICVMFSLYLLKRGYRFYGYLLIGIRLLFSPGRGTILFLLICILFAIVKKMQLTKIRKIAIFFSRPATILIFQLLLGLGIAIFSFFWVQKIVPLGLVEYRTGLNDMSNYQRFNANIYATMELLTNKKFIFGGYGGELRDSILAGVNEVSTKFRGVTLVQPHASIINTLMCMGWIPGLVYFASWGSIFRRIVNEDNIGYFIAFSVYSVILLIYPNNGIELVFALLMIAPKEVGNE